MGEGPVPSSHHAGNSVQVPGVPLLPAYACLKVHGRPLGIIPRAREQSEAVPVPSWTSSQGFTPVCSAGAPSAQGED